MPVDYYPQWGVEDLLALLQGLQRRQTIGLTTSTSAPGIQTIKTFGAGAARPELEMRKVMYSLHLRNPATYTNPYDQRITRTRARYTFS